jgi:hypothetical protein
LGVAIVACLLQQELVAEADLDWALYMISYENIQFIVKIELG